MPGDHGVRFSADNFNMSQAMAGQQGGQLAGMANQATDALSKENDKRAALAREMRRMEFEMARQREAQAHQRQMADLAAKIERLKQASQSGTMTFLHRDGEGWSSP
jgi:hypothetical protein